MIFIFEFEESKPISSEKISPNFERYFIKIFSAIKSIFKEWSPPKPMVLDSSKSFELRWVFIYS